MTGLLFNSLSASNKKSIHKKDTMHTTQTQPELEAPVKASAPGLFSETYPPRAMPRLLGAGDLTALFLLNVFWVTNVTPLAAGGSASFTYWLIGGTLFFVPCSLVLAQLAALFPHEGSLYNWTHHALGPGWAFFVGVCAWLPGVLSIVNAAAAFVSCLQALNPNWFVLSWQQGLVIFGVLAFTGLLSSRRTRVVLSVLKGAAVLMLLATVLIGIAALLWLLGGHPSATNFADASGWRITWGPQANLALLGSVVLALMGSDMPLALGAEIKERQAIPRHLTWGTILTLGGYLVFTFALLAVQGPSVAGNTVNPMLLLLTTVQSAFGRVGAQIMAVCLLCYFLLIPVALNLCFARLFLVAAIDGRVSVRFARLNKERAPTNALVMQVLVAGLFAALLYFLVPQFGFFGTPAAFTSEVYNVLGASLLLIWSVSFIFPFIDLAALYTRDRWAVRRQHVVPFPILTVSVLVGTLLCGATIVITLFNSFIPTLIPNGTWVYLVGGITLVCLSLCAVGSFLTIGQANWEQMSEVNMLPEIHQEQTRS
jgi:glutamate:GABA antiporter